MGLSRTELMSHLSGYRKDSATSVKTLYSLFHSKVHIDLTISHVNHAEFIFNQYSLWNVQKAIHGVRESEGSTWTKQGQYEDEEEAEAEETTASYSDGWMKEGNYVVAERRGKSLHWTQ